MAEAGVAEATVAEQILQVVVEMVAEEQVTLKVIEH
jgi:hypothetical protein